MNGESENRRIIEDILREEERKGHILRVSMEAIMEKIEKRKREGWEVFMVPMIPQAMLALAEIEHTHYPPDTDANEGFELINLWNYREPEHSFTIALCKPFAGCREKLERILWKYGSQIFRASRHDFRDFLGVE